MPSRHASVNGRGSTIHEISDGEWVSRSMPEISEQSHSHRSRRGERGNSSRNSPRARAQAMQAMPPARVLHRGSTDVTSSYAPAHGYQVQAADATYITAGPYEGEGALRRPALGDDMMERRLAQISAMNVQTEVHARSGPAPAFYDRPRASTPSGLQVSCCSTPCLPAPIGGRRRRQHCAPAS